LSFKLEPCTSGDRCYLDDQEQIIEEGRYLSFKDRFAGSERAIQIKHNQFFSFQMYSDRLPLDLDS
jgi:hypothetical protein